MLYLARIVHSSDTLVSWTKVISSMFLKKIALEDVRSIHDIELSFDCDDAPVRKWTLLLGENGTGKSTLLKSIGLILSGSEALSDNLAEPSAWIRLGKDRCRLSATLMNVRGEERHISLQIHRSDKLTDVIRQNRKAMLELDQALEHSNRNYFLVGYGVSRRLSSTQGTAILEQPGYRTPRGRSIASLFNADAPLNSLENWAMDLEYRRGKKGLHVIQTALNNFLPEVSFSRIDRENRRLIFDTPDGAVPLNMLSDGYQNAAGWCGDLLYRITEIFSDYKNPLAIRGILLIDEIDLHLHPLWQRQLRKYLNEQLPNFQIIASTHSALTAQQSGPQELFVMRRVEVQKEIKLFQCMGDPQKLLVHQLLLSDMFELPSLNSPQIQAKREEYVALKKKHRLSEDDRRRLSVLRKDLEDVPDWTRETKRDRELRALLNETRKELISNNGHHGKHPRIKAKRAVDYQTSLIEPKSLAKIPAKAKAPAR
jgi:energy-coupling factor transporter ATP-binding protein EcfA2